jgi:hypothetical protein
MGFEPRFLENLRRPRQTAPSDREQGSAFFRAHSSLTDQVGDNP